MQAQSANLSDLKFNLETWRRELKFHSKEMDTFREKLEEIAGREFSQEAMKPLENFQNRIMIEKSVISKLSNRCKKKMFNLDRAALSGGYDPNFQYEQTTLRDDMKTYIRMHYDLKEEMMDYFLEWL